MPKGNPWQVLVGAVLSTRTKDEVTVAAAKRLLKVAPSPQRLAELKPEEVAREIYPVGFYQVKSKLLISLAGMIIKDYQGKVPKRKEELLRLPGVGKKVANIVLAQGFGVPAIAVDTHVHRISNRLGLVRTARPEMTEKYLHQILPRRFWLNWNRFLVALGQTVCLPRFPKCGLCPVVKLCAKCGVRVARDGKG
ncbi:MAG: endonuclease III [candidate division WOR-3 bacterium]